MKFILFFVWSLGTLVSYEYSVAICSVFKDEAPWLKEWIEYHKMLGVGHFRLYNNESSDDYLNVLAPYIAAGEVTLIDWPNQEGDFVNWACLRQWPACMDGVEHLKGVAKWVALIDTDEFIFPLEASDLISFLSEYEEYPGIVLNWQCFGTSLIEEIPEGKLMIEMLTKKAVEYSIWNKPVKSIVRPTMVDTGKRDWGTHTVHYLCGDVAVFPDKIKRAEDVDMSEWEIHPQKAVINHYLHRTESFFWEKKMAKKEKMENWKYLKDPLHVARWYLDCNSEIDERIFRFVPELRKRVF